MKRRQTKQDQGRLSQATIACEKNDRCPNCHIVGKITAERVIVKGEPCTQCCCHACGYVWEIPD